VARQKEYAGFAGNTLYTSEFGNRAYMLYKLSKNSRKPLFTIIPDEAIFMQVGIKAQARWIAQKEHHNSSFAFCVVQPTRSFPSITSGA
jgi:hypothetical protein